MIQGKKSALISLGRLGFQYSVVLFSETVSKTPGDPSFRKNGLLLRGR